MWIRRRPGRLTLFACVLATGATLLLAGPIAVPDASASPVQDDVVMEQGRQTTQQFYDHELDKLWSRFTERMKQAMNDDPATLEKFRQQIADQLGAEEEVTDERLGETQGFDVYRRTARFEKFDGPVNVQWAFDDQGQIGGFTVRPAE